MYDRLWEESPKVQKIRAESEVQAMQRMLVSVVKARFPTLTQLAQEQAVQINSPDTLDLLVQKIRRLPLTKTWFVGCSARQQPEQGF